MGGGKTAKNASMMLEQADLLHDLYKQQEEASSPEHLAKYEDHLKDIHHFIAVGLEMGMKLHEHAHKRLPEYQWPTPGEWALAGEWSRRASTRLREIREETSGESVG
jgi:hypothetical protein